MLKRSIFIGIFAVILILVTVVLSEIALRMLYPIPWYGYEYLPPQKNLFRHDREIGWVGRPDASGVFASMDFKVRVHHDENGFRNRNPFYDKDKKNYAILGDSFGWGWGVADDEVVASVMTRRGGANAYSLAAPGYGTDQQFLTLRRFFHSHPEYRPDKVVVLFFVNDFEDNMFFSRYGYVKSKFDLRPNGELVLTGVPVINPVPSVFVGKRELKQQHRSFWRVFHLYNLLRFYIENHRLPHAEPFPPRTGPWTEMEEQQVTLAVRLLTEIRDLATSRGASLLVVSIFPDTERRYGPLRSRLGREKIPYKVYRRTVIPLNELWNDHHLNAIGHRDLASKILKWTAASQ